MRVASFLFLLASFTFATGCAAQSPGMAGADTLTQEKMESVCAAWPGEYSGKWERTDFEHILTISDVNCKAGTAHISYFWDNKRFPYSGTRHLDGKIGDDGCVRISWSGVSVRYCQIKDGMLAGVRKDRAGIWFITMKKVR